MVVRRTPALRPGQRPLVLAAQLLDALHGIHAEPPARHPGAAPSGLRPETMLGRQRESTIDRTKSQAAGSLRWEGRTPNCWLSDEDPPRKWWTPRDA